MKHGSMTQIFKTKVLIVGAIFAVSAPPAFACSINPVPVFMADRVATDVAIAEIHHFSSAPITDVMVGWRDTIEFHTVVAVKGTPIASVTKILGRPDATPDCPFERANPEVGDRYVIWFKPGFPDGVYDVRLLSDVRREVPSWPEPTLPTTSTTAGRDTDSRP